MAAEQQALAVLVAAGVAAVLMEPAASAALLVPVADQALVAVEAAKVVAPNSCCLVSQAQAYSV